MTSELEYFDSDCEMTVLPQPNAPGMAVVPPWTQLKKANKVMIARQYRNRDTTEPVTKFDIYKLKTFHSTVVI